jgi:hypothetical protein
MQQISDQDQEYIDELLKDVLHRAKTFPDEVFQQLSSLSVGPIVTDAVTQIELGDSRVGDLYPGFVHVTAG